MKDTVTAKKVITAYSPARINGIPALYSENQYDISGDFLLFEQEFEEITGICLTLYKEKQMKRRINTLITRKGISDYETFMELLKSDPGEFAAFLDYITINVTEFFRTPDHWKFFEQIALPDILGYTDDRLKIWSCACSSGEEPYSLAMSLCRVTEPERFHIIATDIDSKVLGNAIRGQYSAKSIENLPEEVFPKELRAQYFLEQGSNLQIADELKKCVTFQRLDLHKDRFPQNCDLIVCRNVLIYFTEQAKENIYTKISESLKKGGYLFTGNTEQIIYYKKFNLRKITGYLYQKI